MGALQGGSPRPSAADARLLAQMEVLGTALAHEPHYNTAATSFAAMQHAVRVGFILERHHRRHCSRCVTAPAPGCSASERRWDYSGVRVMTEQVQDLVRFALLW